MSTTLIESNEEKKTAYDSLMVSDPQSLSVFNNKLSIKIIKSLAEKPSYPLDIARKLKIHEQKIYYHLKKLERAGIVYTISSEMKHGMIAKIYSVVSPVVAVKLFDKGSEIKEKPNIKIPSTNILKFFDPFIEDGKLNAKIIVGDTHPHGKYDFVGRESAYIPDLLLFIGQFLDEFDSPNYKLDTEVTQEDLQKNLILIGNNKTNTIIEKINSDLPIKFDQDKSSIVSYKTNKIYKDDRVGIILKTRSPFNSKKSILLIGNQRTAGIVSAVIYILKYLENRFKKIENNDEILIVTEGLDKDGDKIIDDIRILEES